MTHVFKRMAVASMLTLACAGALAQEALIHKPMRMVVPFPPGGGADAIGRLFAKKLGEEVGQSIVVENKPGANGFIAARDVVSAPNDGHQLLFVTDGTYSIAPHMLPPGVDNLIDDLEGVIHLVDNPLVIIARPSLGVKNLDELIDLAKKKEGELTYAANNTGSTHFVAMQILMREAGIKMRHIPYSGGSQAIPDLVGGLIDLMVGTPAAVEPARAANKDVHYVAVTSSSRFPSLGQVPTVSETLPGYAQPAAMGLMVRKGTAPSVIERLNEIGRRILEDPDMQRQLISYGGLPAGGSVEDFNRLISEQSRDRRAVLKDLGLVEQ